MVPSALPARFGADRRQCSCRVASNRCGDAPCESPAASSERGDRMQQWQVKRMQEISLETALTRAVQDLFTKPRSSNSFSKRGSSRNGSSIGIDEERAGTRPGSCTRRAFSQPAHRRVLVAQLRFDLGVLIRRVVAEPGLEGHQFAPAQRPSCPLLASTRARPVIVDQSTGSSSIAAAASSNRPCMQQTPGRALPVFLHDRVPA